MQFPVTILPQPNDTTCGPTCLHAVYQYYEDTISLEQVLAEVASLEHGGTLAVFLGCHALARGYRAHIYTYNLTVFDPTWFATPESNIAERLQAQLALKSDPRLHAATRGYLEFLERGGELRFQDLTRGLIRSYMNRGTPVITGLSSTYLYRAVREFGPASVEDDVRGEPAGHFVVLCGYDAEAKSVLIADPLDPNPLADTRSYRVGIDRVVCSILLGVITHDANLLVIKPKSRRSRPGREVHGGDHNR